MQASRTLAIVLRQVYLLRGSPTRLSRLAAQFAEIFL